MSKHAPGSKDWWIETGLIAAVGFAIAAWLWDGPLAERVELMEEALADEPLEFEVREPRTLGDLFESGCITGEHLQALREGRQVQVFCPEGGAMVSGPPEDRLFP